MNGAATTNKGVIALITTTIAVLATMCVLAICVMAYLGTKIPPELNTLTAGLVGYLGAMLVKTSPTETQTQPPHPTPLNPAPVQVVNKPTDPVPTTDEALK